MELTEVNYTLLDAAIPSALPLIDEPPGLWRTILIESQTKEPGHEMTLFSILTAATGTARIIAPTREGKEKWLRVEWDITLRMLRDPITQRVYADRGDAGDHASRFDYVARIQGNLQGVRFWLVREGIVGPADWGLLQGLTWVSDPGAVIVRNGVPFVERKALETAGVPVQVAGGRALAALGGRQAAIPIGEERQASARQGFRDATGRIYVPAQEFHRQGVYHVRIIKDAQMVEIWPEHPPSDHHSSPSRG